MNISMYSSFVSRGDNPNLLICNLREVPGYLRWILSGIITRSNQRHIFVTQLGSSRPLSNGLPSPNNSVHLILLHRPVDQMFRIAARRIVASMTSVFGPKSICQEKGDDMGTFVLPIKTQPSISVRGMGTHKRPARIRATGGIDSIPKPLWSAPLSHLRSALARASNVVVGISVKLPTTNDALLINWHRHSLSSTTTPMFISNLIRFVKCPVMGT